MIWSLVGITIAVLALALALWRGGGSRTTSLLVAAGVVGVVAVVQGYFANPLRYGPAADVRSVFVIMLAMVTTAIAAPRRDVVPIVLVASALVVSVLDTNSGTGWNYVCWPLATSLFFVAGARVPKADPNSRPRKVTAPSMDPRGYRRGHDRGLGGDGRPVRSVGRRWKQLNRTGFTCVIETTGGPALWGPTRRQAWRAGGGGKPPIRWGGRGGAGPWKIFRGLVGSTRLRRASSCTGARRPGTPPPPWLRPSPCSP